MKIYLTICNKEKRYDKRLLEAVKRYSYPRINKIYAMAKKDEVEFRIFSGKFGLLKPKDKIPWYDQKLNIKYTSKLKKLVEGQLKKENIREIIFFINRSTCWKPYISVIEKVSRNLKIKLEKRFI